MQFLLQKEIIINLFISIKNIKSAEIIVRLHRQFGQNTPSKTQVFD